MSQSVLATCVSAPGRPDSVGTRICRSYRCDAMRVGPRVRLGFKLSEATPSYTLVERNGNRLLPDTFSNVTNS